MAEGWIDALLKIHPQSYAAYEMRGQMFQGNRGRARGAYQQALAILQAGSEQRHAPFEGGQRVTQDIISALAQRIRAIDAAGTTP